MNERLRVSQGTIHFGKEPLGTKEILADPGEFRDVEDVEHLQLPGRIDLVFAVGDRVAAAECKYPADLVTSHQRRRLQRQLRYIREVADIGILFLRNFYQRDVQLFQGVARQRNVRYRASALWQDLAGFQTQGGYVLHLPKDDEEAVEFIRWYQQGLVTSGARAFAGTDTRPKVSGPGKLLQAIPGIGPKMAQRLMAQYGTPLNVGLAAYSQGAYGDVSMAKEFGPNVVKKIRAAFEEGK